MISMRKQVFGLLLCTGITTILLTACFVNLTIHKEFKRYVESNIQKASMTLVDRLEEAYELYGTWDETIVYVLSEEMELGNFSLAILDQDKNYLWGITEEKMLEKVKNLDYPLFYGSHLGSQHRKLNYTVKDLPIQTTQGIVGYARIGYFPSFLLSTNDILFQANINESIVISGSIAMFGLIGIGLYITRLFTKPIYDIAIHSAELAEGKYKTRYNRASRITEIENLRHSMNYLAQKLEQQDRLRRKLISDVSHEIRTPLHIVQSNLEAMIDGIYPIDEVQMEVLYQEVIRFSSLLNNLDKLKNIEEDHMDLVMEEMHINTCIQEVYNTFKIVAKERGITYELMSYPTKDVIVKVDRGAMKQILMNLLSNAFKFTKQGKIRITTQKKDKQLMIIIEDTGIGIAKEDLPYVFERMYRGDKSREQFEGSGIGLTIVKKLMLLQGGKVTIESENQKGTRVIIVLPIHHLVKNNKIKHLNVKE